METRGKKKHCFQKVYKKWKVEKIDFFIKILKYKKSYIIKL